LCSGISSPFVGLERSLTSVGSDATGDHEIRPATTRKLIASVLEAMSFCRAAGLR
jgi:hypothetical protein